MSDTLTQLIAKLQADLMDDGTIFSTATCTACIRHALARLNMLYPIQGGTLIATVADQYEYELTEALAGAVPLQITDVLLADPSGREFDTPLTFRPYSEDERFFIRLQTPQPADGNLIVRYTQAHTINGLDSATESTLSAQADLALLDGAAAEACKTAAVGKILSNNLDPQAAASFRAAYTLFDAVFKEKLDMLSSRRRLQASEPRADAWNDEHRTWPHRLM